MSLTHDRIEINATTPTMITVEGAESMTNCTIQVQNLGSEAVYIGAANLTNTSYGVSIVPGGAVTIDDLMPKDELYALSASGDSYVAVLRVNR